MTGMIRVLMLTIGVTLISCTSRIDEKEILGEWRLIEIESIDNREPAPIMTSELSSFFDALKDQAKVFFYENGNFVSEDWKGTWKIINDNQLMLDVEFPIAFIGTQPFVEPSGMIKVFDEILLVDEHLHLKNDYGPIGCYQVKLKRIK